MESLKKGIIFNNFYKELINEGKANDFKFLSLNGETAYERHKLTDDEIKSMAAGSGCCYKKNIEFFSKNRDVGIKSDIQISLKIDHHFPAFVAYSKGKCFGKFDSRDKNSAFTDKFKEIIEELKSIIFFLV